MTDSHRISPSRRTARRRILVTGFGAGTPDVKSTTWLRAAMFGPRLARQGIDLHVSGTVPKWVWPYGWYGGWRSWPRRLWGLTTGALKRLGQALILPYRYDAYVALRDVYTFTGPAWFERLFSRRANYLVFDLDDALWLEPPGKSPIGWTDERAVVLASRADRVIAGNSFLADWAGRYCDNVVVIPTTADVDISPRQGPRTPGPVRIGWYGSLAGALYLEAVLPAMEKAAAESAVEYHFVTNPLIETALTWPVDLPRRITAWDPHCESEQLGALDVGMMPLPDDDWSRGKCGAKILHYMAAGLPVVASPVGVNRDIVVAGETGFLARTHDEWVDALVTLASDTKLRERMGKAGRLRFEERYHPSLVAELYAEAVTPPADVRRKRFFAGTRRRR